MEGLHEASQLSAEPSDTVIVPSNTVSGAHLSSLFFFPEIPTRSLRRCGLPLATLGEPRYALRMTCHTGGAADLLCSQLCRMKVEFPILAKTGPNT